MASASAANPPVKCKSLQKRNHEESESQISTASRAGENKYVENCKSVPRGVFSHCGVQQKASKNAKHRTPQRSRRLEHNVLPPQAGLMSTQALYYIYMEDDFMNVFLAVNVLL